MTTGNFLFDQLIDARRASLQSRAEDTDVAGHRCRERLPDGVCVWVCGCVSHYLCRQAPLS